VTDHPGPETVEPDAIDLRLPRRFRDSDLHYSPTVPRLHNVGCNREAGGTEANDVPDVANPAVLAARGESPRGLLQPVAPSEIGVGSRFPRDFAHWKTTPDPCASPALTGARRPVCTRAQTPLLSALYHR
jgi:hypothetical protein